MKNKGFTLIEVVVAVGIFSINVAVLMGFFSQALNSQKKSLANEETIDNLSYILEYTSRSLRMAKKDDIGGVNCLSGDRVNYEVTRSGNGIKFRNYKDECQEFFLEGGRLKEWKKVGAQETENFFTAQNITVNSFQIGPTTSWDQGDNEQPRVTLFIQVQNEKDQWGSSPLVFSVQTTISQRNLDVQK